jgi:AraC-like DNA-binding protein
MWVLQMETRTYNDFDAFADDVTSFDGQILLNNPHRPEWSISHIDLGGVHIQSSSVGSGNIVEGESWDGYMIYLPLTGACKKVLNGTQISQNSLLVLEPGSDICLSSSHEHSWCSIFIPTAVWARAGHSIDLTPGCEKGACRVTRPNRQIALQGMSLVRNIQLAAATYPEFESTYAASIAAEDAAKFVSMVTGERPKGEPKRNGRPQISRQEIIRRCKSLMEEREGERISVAELTARADVSERTLETVFKDYYGVLPTRYLQLRNLRDIRCALRVAKYGERTVTEILADHGEYELGRFARRYCGLYGELPSQTLHKKCTGCP